ncbi:MAG: threo-3-hydroxy-L-aspartate ammonia-lyase [Rhodothermales bacterium]
MPDATVVYTHIEAAAKRIAGAANVTPVHTSKTLDEHVGARIFFKCENFQRAGAFKFRGAYNALSLLSDAKRRRGVLSYSSGNHAQAVALAGRELGIETTIIMPEDAPRVKLEATRGYGAQVVTYDRKEITREELARQIADDRGLPIIPPYDHPHIVAGQGTAAREFIREVGDLDLLLVCCGGGGLLSGSAVAARALLPNCKIVGVEPEQADDAARSFRTGTLHTVHNPDTVADGARTPSLGEVTFPLILEHVDAFMTVSERAIVRAMHFLWQRMKLVVEPTGALAAAALFDDDKWAALFGEEAPERPGRIGVVISGGNVELPAAVDLFRTYDLE